MATNVLLLSVRSDCYLSICTFNCFSFGFRGRESDSGNNGS